ncbi:Gas vesicle protein [Mycobacterium sp. JS623]|uniref:gas vesicle protein GvpJ n=1 Tax=Mycobacterium sp. JS623 TaxID=212767 RepID=UPI0002A594B8|nr:gas vesicle protein GvpJ [Mycobacterium sp. JS623]AGB25751.1 Gas vesicle protein [Mycobacterium sp. JS623]
MTVATHQGRNSPVERSGGGRSGNLADVIELILDKGLVIDVFVRVSLVGIELLTIDARIVVASVDTFLRFAEATNRLDLYAHGGKDLGDLAKSVTEGGAKGKSSGAIEGAVEKVGEMFTRGRRGDDEDEDEAEEEPAPRRRPRPRARERR